MSLPFDQFDLCQKILDALSEIGYENATPIQADVIPPILEGKDVLAKAKTGSGKTAAFSLPAIQRLAENSENTSLVITPTRELAMQVCEEISTFTKHLKISPCVIYGGESFERQKLRIKKDSRIIVGTPGRLLDLLSSGKLKNFKPQIVVLDEADEMLNMGFLEDIQKIFEFLPAKRQTLMFSATLPPEIKKISQKILVEPVLIDHLSKDTPHEDIHQVYHLINHRERTEALVRVLQYHIPKKSIVFCNTKKQVDELFTKLTKCNFQAVALHGDMSQADRKRSIDRFRNAKESLLIATDVAGRGISVSDITHVFNYELPFSPEGYTHRIGRTGRMGNKGIAITFVSNKQVPQLRRFLKTKASKITFSDIPTLELVKNRHQDRFRESIQEENIDKDAEKILKTLTEKEDLKDISLKLISRFFRKEMAIDKKEISTVSVSDSSEGRKNNKRSFFKSNRRPPRRGRRYS